VREREAEIEASQGRIAELEQLAASIGSAADVEAQLEAANTRLAQLHQAELAAEDAMCLAQLEQLFRRVKVPWRTRAQLAALYLGQYAEVREHFSDAVEVSRALIRKWLIEHPVGRAFWLRLAERCGLPVEPFNASKYQIEHILNAAWGGADHPLNFMILFVEVNNSVEFRTGPCHLKMIALGRRLYEFVQRFARWNVETKLDVARYVFVDQDATFGHAWLLDGPADSFTSTMQHVQDMRSLVVLPSSDEDEEPIGPVHKCARTVVPVGRVVQASGQLVVPEGVCVGP